MVATPESALSPGPEGPRAAAFDPRPDRWRFCLFDSIGQAHDGLCIVIKIRRVLLPPVAMKASAVDREVAAVAIILGVTAASASMMARGPHDVMRRPLGDPASFAEYAK